uniref:Putative replicase n=1 Tax=Retsystermes virus TaxID=2796629 RepID=A0A7T7K909_9VIRU|nr:putative replicase [Retsystermes virus]
MGPFRRKTLKRYVSQMSAANPNVVFDDHVAEIIEQQGFTWEEDPRSIYDPQQLYSALERYATEWDDFECMDEHLRFGFVKAFKIFAKPRASDYLKVLSERQVVTSALKLSKSAGLPLMSDKASSLVYSFDREEQIRLGLKQPNPCIAYKRTQQGNKTRLVWGYPLEMTIMESRFARPLIDRFLKMRTPMAFGLRKVDLGAYIHRYVVDTPGTIVALDYSKYDSTLSRTMIKQAFRILSTWFSEEEQEQWQFSRCVSYFLYTPIVMPDGHLYHGKNHGVPSGSYFTQLVDSIVNVALCYALSSALKFSFNAKSLLVLGDDVILNVKGDVDLESWANYLSTFGLQLNLTKTRVGEPHFLGAFWYKGKPDVPVEELAKKSVFPENYRYYGGQPHREAESVLRSYASSYLSAISLLPLQTDQRSVDFPWPGEQVIASHLSGSDRFLLEESEFHYGSEKRRSYATLSYRILL